EVDRLGDELLSGAGLARDHDRKARVRDALEEVEDLSHGRALADHVPEAADGLLVVATDLGLDPLELEALGLVTVLGFLELVSVREGDRRLVTEGLDRAHVVGLEDPDAIG